MVISEKDKIYAENLIWKAENLKKIIEEEMKPNSLYFSPSNVVFFASLAIELSTKAIFVLFGINFPPIHDVGFEKGSQKIEEVKNLLKKSEELKEKFPNWKYYLEEIPKMIQLCQEWGGKEIREHAVYGNEESKTPPDKLFDREKANIALEDVKKCLSIVSDVKTFFDYNKNINV